MEFNQEIVSVTWSHQNPDDLLLEIGEYLQSKKQFQKAIQYYQGAISLNELNSLAAYRLGKLYYHLNKHESALEILLKASSLTPDHLDTLYFLGRTYEKLNHIDKALHMSERILNVLPHHPGAYLLLIKLHARLGHWEKVKLLCKNAPSTLVGSKKLVRFCYVSARLTGDVETVAKLEPSMTRKDIVMIKEYLTEKTD